MFAEADLVAGELFDQIETVEDLICALTAVLCFDIDAETSMKL